MEHSSSTTTTGTSSHDNNTDNEEEWVTLFGLLAVTIQMIRIAIHLIQRVTNYQNRKEETEAAANTKTTNHNHPSHSIISSLTDGATTTMTTANNNPNNNYGSVHVQQQQQDGNDDIAHDNNERASLLLSSSSNGGVGNGSGSRTNQTRIHRLLNWIRQLWTHKRRNLVFLFSWTVLFVIFFHGWWWSLTTTRTTQGSSNNSPFPSTLFLSTWATVVLEIYVLIIMDWDRQQYGVIQRMFHLVASILLWSAYAVLWKPSSADSSSVFYLLTATLYVVLVVADSWSTSTYSPPEESADDGNQDEGPKTTAKKKQLSKAAIFVLVKPYVWPDATTESALYNRLRAIGTWVCVISSKVCGLVSPLFLGWASTALAHQDYKVAIQYSILYSVISWCGTTFKEGQSLIYLKVAQVAFVHLSQTAFGHLHNLSLDWHLRKKLGEVLRSMDRGIAACDSLMKWLFLWLVPAIVECLVVCIIFATYFKYLPLAVTVFYFVFCYIVWTIVVTVWRKKFRKALVKRDNEWHDRFTDSLVNFETVKFFTAEKYEMDRFAEAVSRYQAGSVDVQGSLSLLNISQQIILKVCLAMALSLTAMGIQKRIDCCIQVAGCESGISECCQNVSISTCPGMQVGDFVAVLTYTLNLFAPLSFLGSVYNAIVMALVDLGNMSELLAESPDVVDAPDAMELPRENASDPDVAVEFDNVHFHYPTQPEIRGLKGLSFKMKRGSTTAIVGSTGCGKTTVSRLLFRFYDVLGGAVKINGVDVRALTQQSLRGSIGVVPQSASMFNDTIRSNLLYGRRDASEDELIQAARDAQILDFIETLDDGWDTIVGDRGLKLSGGEKQRAAIARCLLKNPPFVLLDEATSALDTLTENSVQEALDRLGAERTVLVIAHRLGTIRNADNIVVLQDGRATEEGTHDELLAKNGLYADMWNMQLHSTSTDQTSLDAF